MSCQIKGVARLVDPIYVRNRLVRDNKHKSVCPENELPLQDCLISLSPAGDILVLAQNSRIIVLSSKWDSKEPGDIKNKFHVIYEGDLSVEQSDFITSVICLPLITHGKRSVGIDWTCIAVGFNNGYIKFYTETGDLLVQEQLHNESIISIKCQSHSSAKHTGDAGTQEEIHVQYGTCVCILLGFPLFSTIRACRNHLARVKANSLDHDDKPPAANLSCKKWSFKNQDIANDSEVIGSTSVNTFDHLKTASIVGGYNANYRSSAPQHNLVIATGIKPFIGFHYALQGGSVPEALDVAIAVASKVASVIGSAVPSWFGKKTPATPEKTKSLMNEPTESMTCRFGLSDPRREGILMYASPNKHLTAVCDAMGRITLVDNKHGIVVRMWKGYRNAQCGWVEVLEEIHRESVKGHHSKNTAVVSTSRNQKRTALFLIVFAPKKGVIDIWSIQNGTKISTFTANKRGRLLYTNYGICGLNEMPISSGNKPQYSCIFVDPFGEIKEITVPFHFALNSQNSNRARDTHLYKKLKKFLKEEDFTEDKLVNEITNICMDLKTNDIRLQTLEMLMINKHINPSALLAAVNCFSKQLEAQTEGDLEPVSKTLNNTICQLKRVIKFYNYVRNQFDQPPEYNTVASDNSLDEKQLASTLYTSGREIRRILKLSKILENLRTSNFKVQNKVTFKEDGQTFLDFLSCFEFGVPGFLGLQKEVTDDKKCQISKLIFQGWMYSNDPISKWQDHAFNSDIKPRVLVQFAILYWINKKSAAPLEIELIKFTKLVDAICSIADVEEVCGSYNEISDWWNVIQNILIESTNPFNALTASLVCRAVTISIQINKDRLQNSWKDDNGNEKEDEKNGNKPVKEDIEKKEKGSSSKSNKEDKEKEVTEEASINISDWEKVSKDTCQFSLLIGSLEDISVIEAIASNPPLLDDTTTFYTLPYKSNSVSLGLILSKGKGSVSEIVAKWLSSSGIDPAKLVDTTDIEFDQLQLSVDSLKFPNSLEEAKAVEKLQEDPKTLLSLPIEIGSEAKTEQTALAIVLDKISFLKRYFPYSLTSSVLLSNLLWEFLLFWSKDITQLDALEAALFTIRQIPSKRIRNGVCCLIWNLHLKKKMESAAKLINKSGKLPKERLCMQDVGLTDSQLTTFLQHCVTFLDIFLDTEVLEEESCSFVRSEELWITHNSGPQPFALLAVTQELAWYDLVLLHLQLANVLHMMAHFNLKVSKPLYSLFDSVVNQYFFNVNISSEESMIPSYKDEKRDNFRLDFLCRVITASLESIHQETTAAASFSSSQAIFWINKCQHLASVWKINNDELRIHQVCQMYINGFDRLAEEAFIAVNDTEKLAANLLPVAGGRMMAYLSKAPNLLEEVTRISPALSTYLQSLSWDFPSFVFTTCSSKDTIELIRKVSCNLPETHSEYHISQLMLDATFIYEDANSEKLNG